MVLMQLIASHFSTGSSGYKESIPGVCSSMMSGSSGQQERLSLQHAMVMEAVIETGGRTCVLVTYQNATYQLSWNGSCWAPPNGTAKCHAHANNEDRLGHGFCQSWGTAGQRRGWNCEAVPGRAGHVQVSVMLYIAWAHHEDCYQSSDKTPERTSRRLHFFTFRA